VNRIGIVRRITSNETSRLRLTGLTVYPIKSAGGVAVDDWEVDLFGLRYDRRWMVVNESGEHMTQRTHPRLALVRPSLVGNRLRIGVADRAPLEIPLEPQTAVTTTVVVWEDVCSAGWMGERAAAWFTDLLGERCSLVYMPESTVRPANPAYAPPGVRVSFADAYPFLLISEESLADLTQRLGAPVPMNRFRPNLVIAGGEPYCEDRLGAFRLGGLELQVVKPCDRCVVTTTDQSTGARGPEPLRTLATYRRMNGKVYFGQNVVHRTTGRLRVGDRLLV
jgi:uncharacterized protein YcbX